MDLVEEYSYAEKQSLPCVVSCWLYLRNLRQIGEEWHIRKTPKAGRSHFSDSGIRKAGCGLCGLCGLCGRHEWSAGVGLGHQQELG